MNAEHHLTFDEKALIDETINLSKKIQPRSSFYGSTCTVILPTEFVRAVYSNVNSTRYIALQRYEHYQTMCNLILWLPAHTLTSCERLVLQTSALSLADFSEPMVQLMHKYYGEDIVDTIRTVLECTHCKEYNCTVDMDTLVLLMRLVLQSSMLRPFHVHLYWVYKEYSTMPSLICVAKRMLTRANLIVKPLMNVLYARFPSTHKSVIYDNFTRNEFIWMTYFTADRLSIDRKRSELETVKTKESQVSKTI